MSYGGSEGEAMLARNFFHFLRLCAILDSLSQLALTFKQAANKVLLFLCCFHNFHHIFIFLVQIYNFFCKHASKWRKKCVLPIKTFFHIACPHRPGRGGIVERVVRTEVERGVVAGREGEGGERAYEVYVCRPSEAALRVADGDAICTLPHKKEGVSKYKN